MAKKDIDKELKAQQEYANIQKEINDALGLESNLRGRNLLAEQQLRDTASQIKIIEEALMKYAKDKRTLSKGALANYKDQLIALKKQSLEQQKSLDILKKQKSTLENMTKLANMLGSPFQSMWKYLQDSDKAIKGLTLELGLSGKNAETLRDNINGSATYAAKLGASVEDLAKIQSQYSDETSRTVSLTAEQFKNITNIGKGTSLGVEQAGKLVGQFDLLGISVSKTEDFVQGVVDSSERIGINANKVLKNISQNFKTLNTFSFKEGIKGMAKLAQYSETYKLNMEEALNSAKMSRTLEGAIEMASQLNVLGGEFAKQDPFELLNLSRNDPAKYAKKIAEMTKGLATLQKTEEGFKIGISPLDQDRISEAAKALGMTNEELTQTALKFKQIQLAKQQMLGLNLDPKDQEAIAGMAKFSESSGKMYAEINGTAKDISQLSRSDIELLKTQKKSLADRAKDAVTFDEAFKNTINELKSALLPVLQAINKSITWMQGLFGGAGTKWVAGIGAAAISLGAAFSVGLKTISKIKDIKNMVTGIGGGGLSLGGGGGAGGGATGGGMMSQVAGKGGSAVASNLKAIGIAAAGVGVGIGAAAAGFSLFAKALKDLNPEQLKTLKQAMIGLGIAIPVMAGGLILLSASAEASVIGIAIITGALLGIGLAIGIAGAGIGYMSKGLAELSKSTNGEQLLGIAGGIAAIGAATLALGAGGILGAIGGGGALAMILAIGSQAENITKVGEAFKNIGVVLNANASQIERVEKAIMNIASAKVDSNSMFAELSNLLSKPLKVEFADKNISVKSDITLEINRERLVKVLDVGREAVIQTVRQQQGTSSAKRL